MRKYLVILFILIGSILLSSTAVNAADTLFYVRAGASGTGTGADWTNAYTTLPATLSRGTTGATYYIADGNYGGYQFTTTTAAIDGEKIITIKKATVADHGTDTGWDNSYGDGQAVFQQADLFDATTRKYVFTIVTSYLTIDGAVGSGSDPDTYGFKLLQHPSYGDAENVSPYQADFDLITMGQHIGKRTTTSTNIKFLHLALIGGGQLGCVDSDPYVCRSGGIYTNFSTPEGGGLTNLEIGYVYATGSKENIYIMGVNTGSMHHCYVESNVSGYDAHGQNINLDDAQNFDIYNNVFYNSNVFCIAVHMSRANTPSTNVRVYNNIFDTMVTGSNRCIAAMNGMTDHLWKMQVHHNTFVDMGAIPLKPCNLTDVTTNRSYFYNNLIYNNSLADLTNPDHTAGAVVHDYNSYLASSGYTAQAHDQVDTEATSAIFTNYATGDYSIAAANQVAIDHIIGKGKTLASPFDTDRTLPTPLTRTAPFDIGAYDVGGEADTTDPILAEVTPVTASSSNQAPSYVFSSDEAGTVTYGGTCGNGSLSTAVVGNNTTSWALGIGTYSNCTITVTDAASNASTPLAITEFVITPTDSSAAKTIEGGVSFQSLP